MQRGQIFKSHGSWFVRFYRTELVGGVQVRRRACERLAGVDDDHRSRRDCETLADDVLRPVNRDRSAPEGSLTVAEFADRRFLPWVAAKRKPSTALFYRKTFDLYVRAHCGSVRLRDFSTRDAQAVLDGIRLSQPSLLRVKTTMSAILSYAIRLGFVRGANPVREARAEGWKTHSARHAYTLAEVHGILASLAEPARTVCAVAAFAGLRESELRGLRWDDYDGRYLWVRRSVWRTHVGETKTEESEAAVPVIVPLRRILDAHRRRDGSGAWMFAGEKKGFALNLDNLVARVIRPALKDRWHGWHAFRRGLATNLWELGVPAESAQVILRHANAATTREHYILLSSRKAGAAAMRRLETAVAKGITYRGKMGSKRTAERGPGNPKNAA